MPATLTRPTIPTHIQAHWTAWQQRPEVTALLSESLRAYGYTVVCVPPQSRGLFLDILPVLLATDQAAQQDEAQPALRQFWKGWHTWTPRLTAYLKRLAEGKPATFPPFPQQEV